MKQCNNPLSLEQRYPAHLEECIYSALTIPFYLSKRTCKICPKFLIISFLIDTQIRVLTAITHAVCLACKT